MKIMYTNVTELEFIRYNPEENNIWIWRYESGVYAEGNDECYEIEISDDLSEIAIDEESDDSYLVPLNSVKWV